MVVNVSQVSVRQGNGTEKLLGEFNGTVLLIVNVASKCGFTKQYKSLQLLQDEYGQKSFQVLGFPCNDFGGQEPGSLEEIKEFCTSNFQASFTIFEKIHAMGNTTEPFTTLNKSEPKGDVKWNFEKFLVGKDGTVVARFKSDVEPLSAELTQAIENALAA